MSRVTRSTLRTAATSGLIAVSLGLAACGGGNDEQASTPTSPIATLDPNVPKITPMPIPDKITSKIATTTEGKKAIKAASTKRYSQKVLKSEADDLVAKFNAAGLKARPALASTGGPQTFQVGSSSTVMVYPTEQLAATQAASFVNVVNEAGTDGRLARYGHIMAATWAPDGMKKKQLDEWHTVDRIVKDFAK